MFTMALIFAGTNKSYGQDLSNLPATACPNPTILNCATDGELSPIPGKSYTYTVDIDPVVSTGKVNWFVTDAADIITAAGLTSDIELNDGTSLFLLSATAAAYNSATNVSPTIDVSWQSFNGTTNKVLLVAFVQGEAGCADNIEVFRIEPTFAFALEIAGILPNGTLPAGNAEECLTPILTASYDGTYLTMDYGDNYVFFAVNANNFVDSWQPTFTVASTGTPVVLTDVQWAYPAQAILAAGIWNATTVPVDAQITSGAVGAAGECIIVRVHLDHGNVENDVASAVTLTVDGIMWDMTGGSYTNNALADLDNGAAPTDPCVVGSNDVATYDLTPRPNITENNPNPGFEPKN